jgi:hypothetical protein
MKIKFLAVLVGCAVWSGCESYWERRAVLQIAVYAPKGAYGEVYAACYGYYSQSGRWPKTVSELCDGLKAVSRVPEHVQTMQELKLIESDGTLDVHFLASNGTRGEMRLERPMVKKKEPINGAARKSLKG